MGISFKLDGICTIYLYMHAYIRCSAEKKATHLKTALLSEKPWCFMTTINFTPSTKNHKWKPHSHKLIRSLFGKKKGGKGPADLFLWCWSLLDIFLRTISNKACLKIIFPFPSWDVSFVGGTNKISVDSWQAIGPTEFLPGSQLFTHLFGKRC